MADHYRPLVLTAAERDALLKELAPSGVAQTVPAATPDPTGARPAKVRPVDVPRPIHRSHPWSKHADD